MKCSTAVAAALLLAHAACRVAPSVPRQYLADNVSTLVKVFVTPLAVRDIPVFGGDLPPPKRPVPSSSELPSPVESSGPPDSPPPPKRPRSNPPESPTPVEPDQPAATPQTEWDKYVCRGEKLTRASKLDKAKAESFALPIGTQFKGTLDAERKLWGYTESPFPDCDIEGEYSDIRRAYEALNIRDEDTQCFRVFHYDPEKVDDNGNEIELEDQTYTVKGKSFRATGAHATFGINVDEGVVFFIDRASAPLKAAETWGVANPPKEQLPALSQMSDLAWGFWFQAHGGSNLGHITKFIIPQVINDITGRLVDNALQTYVVPDGGQRITSVPVWPGISFDVETEPGKALLGSPNGIAAAYFLSQHKEEIGGNKYVKKTTVFRPDDDAESDEFTLVYYVEDAPSPLPEDKNTENSDPNEGLSRRDLVQTANNDNLWHDCVCRGEKLTQTSKNNKDKAIEFAQPIDSPWDGTMEAELELWGYDELGLDSDDCDITDISTALKSLGISDLFDDEGGDNYCDEVRHSNHNEIVSGSRMYEVNGKKYKITDAWSIIATNAVSGTIFFMDVRSAYHAAEKLWHPEVPTAETLPALRSLSDISWAFWNRAQLKQPPEQRNLGNINHFVVHHIVNEDTNNLIDNALKVYPVPEGQQRVTKVPPWPGVIFDIESEAGKALLGSPNGIAAGYFLAQHKTQIGGNKYVYQVQVFTSEWGFRRSMILFVKDAPPPTTTTNAELQGRRDETVALAKRELVLSAQSSPFLPDNVTTLAGETHEEFWQKHVCRGEKLAQACARDKDTAINFMTPIDSEFDGTMEAELKTWGYTDSRGGSMYCELGGIASSLNSIGVDARFKDKSKDGQNACFHVVHSTFGKPLFEQTYEVDGKTYRKTGALAHVGVNARDGLVTYFNVRSAEKAAEMNWRKEPPMDDDLPRLRKISDISWAFWRREHPDGAGLGNIKKFLVHDIINADTLRLMRMVLHRYEVPKGGDRHKHIPKWPGLELGIETPGALAMLGSPNGLAVGYFLAQHKTQLGGNKHVHKVTIWKDDEGDEQMLFWVKDAPPPPVDDPWTTSDSKGLMDTFNKADNVVKRSVDGRNIIREHRVLAKL